MKRRSQFIEQLDSAYKNHTEQFLNELEKKYFKHTPRQQRGARVIGVKLPSLAH